MATPIQLATANDVLLFFMTDSSDHISGKTGLSPTVTLSKNGAAFGSPTGAVSQIGNGWYKVAGNATDTDTLGPLALHATASGADPCDTVVADIVAFNPRSITSMITAVNGIAQTGDSYGALTGAQAEPGQGTPAANASVVTKLAYLYKAWRNKKTQTASAFNLFDDAGSTVDQKSTFTDNGTTASVSEVVTGP